VDEKGNASGAVLLGTGEKVEGGLEKKESREKKGRSSLAEKKDQFCAQAYLVRGNAPRWRKEFLERSCPPQGKFENKEVGSAIQREIWKGKRLKTTTGGRQFIQERDQVYVPGRARIVVLGKGTIIGEESKARHERFARKELFIDERGGSWGRCFLEEKRLSPRKGRLRLPREHPPLLFPCKYRKTGAGVSRGQSAVKKKRRGL